MSCCKSDWTEGDRIQETRSCHRRLSRGAAVPVLQVGHGEVPADEAHLQADDLPVFGGRGAGVFGRAGVVAAAVAGRLRADAVPWQVGHQGRLLEERRHFTDVLHCGETETPADESAELAQRRQKYLYWAKVLILLPKNTLF